MVGEHGVGAQCVGQCGQLFAGHAVAHDEARAVMAAECAYILVQRHQAFADELHPPVSALQGIENLAVKDKNTMHLRALAQCVVQCGVVLGAQVASEPDEAYRVRGLHVHR